MNHGEPENNAEMTRGPRGGKAAPNCGSVSIYPRIVLIERFRRCGYNQNLLVLPLPPKFFFSSDIYAMMKYNDARVHQTKYIP